MKIYLRRHTGDEDPAERESRVQNTARAIGTETILVVEDDEALRSYTTEILAELGYRVLAAHDGSSALQALEHNQIDLLFTDVVMPGGMNGRQLADEAMRRRPGLKVLFTTGYTRNAIVHHGRLDAGVQMIGKPFSFNELGAKVGRCWTIEAARRAAAISCPGPTGAFEAESSNIFFQFNFVGPGANGAKHAIVELAKPRRKILIRREPNACSRIEKLCGGPGWRACRQQDRPAGGFRWISAALRPGRTLPAWDVRQPPLLRFFAHRAPKIR